MAKIGISALHIRPGKCGSHEPYLVNLVKSLSEIDKTNEYFLFINPSNANLFTGLGSNFKLVNCSRFTRNVPLRIFYEQIVLPARASLRKIDVVHFPGNIIPVFHPFPSVVTVHTDSVRARSSMSWFQRLYYDIFLRINKSATRIIAPTTVYKQQLVELYSYHVEQLVAIHHGYDSVFKKKTLDEISNYRKKWGIEKGAILSVTNTLPHKNLPNLLSALEYLWVSEKLEPQLVLVGYIDHNQVRKYITESTQSPERMRARIKIIPFTKNSELPEIYNASSYFVLPSKEECFGMPLIEAMACKLPITASDIPAFKEVAQNAANYFDPDNPIDISEKIRAVLSNDDLCLSLVGNGERLINNYTWKKTAAQTLDTYMQAIIG